VSALEDALALTLLSEDQFLGRAPLTRLQRTFGGHVAAQALVAATRTVGADVAVHSLHGYFLRPGDPTAATEYLVDRVRDGRSFATRRVTGVQRGTAIFTMAASFQVHDEGPDHQEPAPVVPGPEELQDAGATDLAFQQVHHAEWPDWDLRRVTPHGDGPCAPQQQVWLRHRPRLSDDPVLHACALAYASDMTLIGCARLPHVGAALQMASLDHAVWFLRPFRADEWLLYDQTSPSAAAGRGLAHGRIFDRAGRLVATVVQEGLMRNARA
jgi:acyl-CoA thioesterase-2